MTVWGVGWAGPVGAPAARKRPGPSFRVADDVAEEAAAASPVLAVAMPSLLAMQECGSDLVGDREARRHGEAVLDQLRAMQVALLAGPASNRPAALAALMRGMPQAADPALAAVQRALQLRVAVELARSRTALSK